MQGINVLLLTDDLLFGQAIEFALSAESAIAEVTCVADADEAIELAAARVVEVVVLDLDGGFADVAELAARLQACSEQLQIITLGSDADDESALRVIESGGAACVLKSDCLVNLLAAIKTARGGSPPCNGRIAVAVLERIRQLSAQGNALEAVELTDRENEILRLITAAYTNKEIARFQGIAISTAKNHVHRLFEKLQVNCRRDAIRRAIETGVRVRK